MTLMIMLKCLNVSIKKKGILKIKEEFFEKVKNTNEDFKQTNFSLRLKGI